MIGSLVALTVVVALAVTAHVLLKVGMDDVGRIGSDELQSPVGLVVSMLSNSLVVVALPLYASSFVAWTIALSRLQLSVAYPALSMTYFLIPIASWALLNESISVMHWVGIVVVVSGVLTVLVAGL